MRKAEPLQTYNEVLTLSEVMDILHIGKCTAYRLVNEKKLNTFRIGRVIRITKDSLLNFMQKNN